MNKDEIAALTTFDASIDRLLEETRPESFAQRCARLAAVFSDLSDIFARHAETFALAQEATLRLIEVWKDPRDSSKK